MDEQSDVTREASAWPSLNYEAVDWVVDESVRSHLDVFQLHRMQRPYQAAITPVIADLDPASALSRPTLALVESTAATLTHFDQEMASPSSDCPTDRTRKRSRRTPTRCGARPPWKTT